MQRPPAPSLGFDTAGWAVHWEGESQSVAPTHRPLGLVEVLKAARDGELDGHRYRIVHYPDWSRARKHTKRGCLGELRTLEQPVVVNMGLHGIDLWLQDQHAKHPG